MLRKAASILLPTKTIDSLKRTKMKFIDSFFVKSYSQEGEDMILQRVFERYKSGFYVDVGAHHPRRFSNTYLFYKKGWRGINIDAMPGSMDLFKALRPKDINLEIPVSDKKEILTYYIFNEPALNGFSKEISQARDKHEYYSIKATKELETSTLEEILEKFLPEGQQIDFLSIDVEGLDFMVLKSNSFVKFRPNMILIEILGSKMEDLLSNEITLFLNKHNYSIFAKAVHTVIFKKNDFITQ